tara:strand:+ start:52 stop:645 length:594 start_codon:yes stop_codon:yes gene_type:complete
MENFSNLFIRLKEERGLSNKQIASFTGATLKEVKRWESGVGVPTEKRIIAALEGILGDEISKGIKNLTIKENTNRSPLIEDSVFEVDKAKQKNTSSGFLNRFRREKEKKRMNTQTEIYTYENLLEVEELTDKEIDKSAILYEDAIQEEPYINDPKQIAFYITRNFKATIWVILFIYFSIKGFELFWDSLKGLINNLL